MSLAKETYWKMSDTHIMTKKIKNSKIKSKLVMLFIVLSFVPMTIFGFFAYYELIDTARSKISTYSSEIMAQLGESIDRELQEIEYYSMEILSLDIVQNTLLHSETMNPFDINDAQSIIHSELTKKLSLLHDVSDVLLYTGDGRLITAYGSQNTVLNLKNEVLNEFLSKIADKKGEAVWAALNGADDNIGIFLGREVRSLSDSDRVIGSLIIRINDQLLPELYRNINVGSGSDILVFDGDGNVVSGGRSEISNAASYGYRQLADEINKNSSRGLRAFDFSVNGNSCIVAFSRIEKINGFIASTIPDSYIFYESGRIGFNILALGVVFFILAVVLSSIYYSHMTRPLERLVSVMDEVRKGNLSVSIKDTGTDEIGEVIGHFNEMLNDINRLMENIKAKEEQKRIAELKSLQAQINPHFLSNTLNTIKWMAKVQNAENIENIITSLIQLLHASMGKGGDYICIREEIEYIKHYINIQEYRYLDKFKVLFEIEDDVLDYMIPKFLLQPIVENSLIHGIGPMEGQGMVIIKAFTYGKSIKITVTDNGVGISEDKLDLINKNLRDENGAHFSGIGIRNVHERIVLNYGEPYGLEIRSVPNLYTAIEINLPIIKAGGLD